MSTELFQRLGGAFQSEVLKPMLAAAVDDPSQVRHLIGVIREKLDALDVLLDGYGAIDFPPPEPANGKAVHVPVLNGHPTRNAEDTLESEEIGRNQRSRLREMALLEALASDTRPFSLQQLLKGLEDRGFADGSAAIVSQLHRMKKLGVIEQPANGMYEVTQDGLGHMRKLRASFGALIKGDSRPSLR